MANRRERRPRYRLGLLGIFTAMCFVAAACGQSGGAASGGGSTLTVAETTAPSTLDPTTGQLFADRFAWNLSYQCLLTTTASGAVVPQLATSYTVSADRRTYTFDLRPHVKFDNGETLTSADVVYTFDRLMSNGTPTAKELFPTLTSVTAVSASVVQFHLSSPDAGFVDNMANPLVWGCAILSEKAGKSENLALNMVGTGPWQQTSYSPNSELTLMRFAGYWGAKTATRNLNVLYVPTKSTQVSDLEAGKVDLIFSDKAGAASLAHSSAVTVKQVPADTTVFLQINDLTKPLDNLKVRQAIALALNRNQMAQQAYQGAAAASVYVPPGSSWAPSVSAVPLSEPDIAKAKQLLAEAGYPHGFSTTLMYISGYDPGTNSLAAVIQNQLAAAGIKITLQPMDVATWGSDLTSHNYAISWNEQSYYSDPYQYVVPVAGRQGPVPAVLQTMLNTALAAKSVSAYEADIVKIENEEATLVYPTVTLLALSSYVGYRHGMTGVDVPPSLSRDFLAGVGNG